MALPASLRERLNGARRRARRSSLRALGIAPDLQAGVEDALRLGLVSGVTIQEDAPWRSHSVWVPVMGGLVHRSFPPRRTYLLRDVTVNSKTGAHYLARGQLVAETSAWPPLHVQYAEGYSKRPRFTCTAPTIVMPTTGFYHWLIEDLPAAIRAKRAFPSSVIAVGPSPGPYLLQGLEMLGYSHISIPRWARLDEAVVATKTMDTGWPDPLDLEEIRGAFLPLSSHSESRKLFVRRRAATRVPVNQTEVERQLAEHGFQPIDPGSLTLLEQIDAFRSASHIVGVHGGALANLAWCSPGARVIELFPKGHVVPCYSALCSLVGATYSSIVQRSGDSRWALDVEQILGLLEESA